MKRITLIIASVLLLASSCQKQESFDELYSRVFSIASSHVENMYHSLPEGRMPRTTGPDGSFKTDGINWWCSGFFPGTLWYVYEGTGNYIYDQYARQYTQMLDTLKTTAPHHDIGFQINCSFGNAYRLTRNEAYKDVIVTAAYRLANRFNPTVGCTRSWNNKEPEIFKVIIDNMMNLELLMKGAEFSGDKHLADIAVTHAKTTLKNHFRDDWSTWHLVIYNPFDGSVTKKQTVQGYSDDSAWARGQAWGLYGYTMMYRFTKDQEFLDAACHIADYLLGRLSEDCVPYWDFDAPDIPNALKDASAGAIMASALVELGTFASGKASKTYLKTAEKMIRALASEEYLAEPGTNNNFILKHSVGNLPGKSEVDVPLTYADYYFLEAILRYREATSEK